MIAQSDDAAGSLNALGTVKLPQDGVYRLFVANQSSTNGPHSIYRLCVRRPQPDFRMTVPTTVETLVGASPITPPKRRRAGRQQTGALGIDVERLDGFAGEIAITLELPPGFHAPDEIKIDAKQTGIDIPISCDADRTPDAQWIVVQATAVVEESDASNGPDSSNLRSITKHQRLLLCPMLEPRSIVRPKYPDAARTVNRGATYPAPVVVERLADFDGPVELQMAAIPDRVRQGILGHAQTIPAGETEGVFPLVIPEWVQTDRTSRITLNSVVVVPDAAGRPRTLVNRMERRITMNVEGALLKINTVKRQYRWTEKTLTLPLELFRSGKLKGPVTVALYAPDSESPIAKTVVDESSLTTQLELTNRPDSGVRQYTLRASARQGIYPVISETTVAIVAP